MGADNKTIPGHHHHDLAAQGPHAVTVEIADAAHYPHETAATQLLSAMQEILPATQPFRYVEDRWAQLLTHPQAVRPSDRAIGRSAGYASWAKPLVKH